MGSTRKALIGPSFMGPTDKSFVFAFAVSATRNAYDFTFIVV